MWYNLPISTKSQKARCIQMSNPTEKAQNSLPLIKKEHRNKVLITLFVLTALAGAGYWAVIAVTSASAPPLALVLRLAYVRFCICRCHCIPSCWVDLCFACQCHFVHCCHCGKLQPRDTHWLLDCSWLGQYWWLAPLLFLAGCGQRRLVTWQRLMDTWCTTLRSL